MYRACQHAGQSDVRGRPVAACVLSRYSYLTRNSRFFVPPGRRSAQVFQFLKYVVNSWNIRPDAGSLENALYLVILLGRAWHHHHDIGLLGKLNRVQRVKSTISENRGYAVHSTPPCREKSTD